MSKLQQYWKELQRRHVVKAGIAYLAIAWIITEVATAVLPLFEVSEVLLKGLVILLAVGFPIWLIIAWVYDFTPEGLKKTEDVAYDPEVSAKKNVQLNRLITGGLSIAVILLVVNQVRMSNTQDQPKAMASMMPDFTSSIAVLAFEDISPNKDQEWLSDGISIQILDHLSKYRDLKIISHRSSFVYKGKDISIDIIGEELGVAYVLDGSIQKAGDTFRTTVQLIDTRDGTQIWSNTYDRKMEDALEVQDEIAQVVADRLNLTLTYEDVRLRKVDPEAFELYLRALREFDHIRPDHMIVADSLIREALDIDSQYAPAWSLLSGTAFQRSFYFEQIPLNEGIVIGLQAAQRAVELDSAYPVAINWLSNWQWHNREGNSSLKTLEELLEKLPNSAGPHTYAGHAFTRMGMPQRALKHAYISRELNPEDGDAMLNIALGEYYRENYKNSIPAFEAFLAYRQEIAGDLNGAGADILAHIYYKSGDIEKAWKTLEKEPSRYWRLVTQILIQNSEGNTEEADRLLEELKAYPLKEIEEVLWTDRNFELGHIYAAKGDKDTAFYYLDKAYDYLLVFTENLWSYPEFKSLHDDPRWQELLDRLGEEFNFDYHTEE